MAMTRQLWSISGLAVELDKDRRFIGQAVKDLVPVVQGKRSLYYLSDVVAAMMGRDDLDLTAEKARLAKAQADKTEIEVAQKRYLLIDADDVRDVWGIQIANVRAKLLGIGHTVAPQVAIEKGVPACRDIIDGRVYEALGELRDFDPAEFGDNKRGDGPTGS